MAVLDKLGDLFDDKGLGRLKDVADSFGDNKDRILEAVDWVWDHREEMVDLMQRLPKLLGETGASLASAGDGAVRAGNLLTGGDGDSVGGLTAAAADALDRCLEQIRDASKLMAGVADQVDDLPMLDGVGGSLAKGADRLEGIGGELGEVALRLRAVGVKITDAGTDLGELGAGLRDGGSELAEFAGKELAAPKKRKASAKPKAPSKTKARAEPKTATTKKKPSAASKRGSSRSGELGLGKPS